MLIKVDEVAKMICRYTSTVDKYVEKGLLPKHVKRDEKYNKTRFWNKQSVIESLPKLNNWTKTTKT